MIRLCSRRLNLVFFLFFRFLVAARESIRVAVRLGEYDITKEIDCLGNNCADPVLYMGVEEKIPHERYDERSKSRENDIGLVRLDGDVMYTDYIKPICLPTTVNSQRSAPNAKLVSAGWGRTLQGTMNAFHIISISSGDDAIPNLIYSSVRVFFLFLSFSVCPS